MTDARAERGGRVLTAGRTGTFAHDALLYRGPLGFVDPVTAFIRDALAHGDLVLVMVTADKIDLLRGALDREADGVLFEDMETIGRNPARIIPASREFLTRAAAEGKGARVIGEPIWSERSTDELVECQRHEELLNLAFAGAAGWLVCPYDARSLPTAVVREARRSHPGVLDRGSWHASTDYQGLSKIARPFDHPLPEPPATAELLAFDYGPLQLVRRFIHERASTFGLDRGRTEELVLAVNEVAANSLRHGGGHGTVMIWHEGDSLVCEIRDAGRISEPLAGRTRPASGDQGGMGLWLVNQFCDLVQVRSLDSGAVVRLHKARAR